MKSRQLIKPDDQLDLTDAELGEEVTKVLTPTNTNVVRNLVVYSFKEGEFVPAPLPGNTVTLISFPGNSLHVDSEEARVQIEESDEIGYPLPMPNYSVVEQRETILDGEDEGEGEGEEDEKSEVGGKQSTADDEEAEEEEDEEGKQTEGDQGGTETEPGADDEDGGGGGAQKPAAAPGKKRKLINQFNYCERATLTYVNPKRVSKYYKSNSFKILLNYFLFRMWILKLFHRRDHSLEAQCCSGSSMTPTWRTLRSIKRQRDAPRLKVVRPRNLLKRKPLWRKC